VVILKRFRQHPCHSGFTKDKGSETFILENIQQHILQDNTNLFFTYSNPSDRWTTLFSSSTSSKKSLNNLRTKRSLSQKWNTGTLYNIENSHPYPCLCSTIIIE